ncbi:hypothetical protein U1Q18_009324 [Sarracenia purpurea var. burkii]
MCSAATGSSSARVVCDREWSDEGHRRHRAVRRRLSAKNKWDRTSEIGNRARVVDEQSPERKDRRMQTVLRMLHSLWWRKQETQCDGRRQQRMFR